MLGTLPLFTMSVRPAAPHLVGARPCGERRIIEVLGGTFLGARVRGDVLPGGADYQLVRPDGVAAIDVRATLRTSDGDLVYLTATGMRHGSKDIARRIEAGEHVDPADYYFRECVFFETGAPRLDFLNRVLTIATRRRERDSATLEVFEAM